jgi:putative SOS response-associated peptidase YedK
VHDRLPVVLDANAAAAWLDPATPAEMAKGIGWRRLARMPFSWHAVDRAIGNVRDQGDAFNKLLEM